MSDIRTFIIGHWGGGEGTQGEDFKCTMHKHIVHGFTNKDILSEWEKEFGEYK